MSRKNGLSAKNYVHTLIWLNFTSKKNSAEVVMINYNSQQPLKH